MFISDPPFGGSNQGALYQVTPQCPSTGALPAMVNLPSKTILFGYSFAASAQNVVALGQDSTGSGGNAWVRTTTATPWSGLPALADNCNFLRVSQADLITELTRPDQYTSITDNNLLVSCSTKSAGEVSPNAVRAYLLKDQVWTAVSEKPLADAQLQDAHKISIAQNGQLAIIGATRTAGVGAAWAVRCSAGCTSWSAPFALAPEMIAATGDYGFSVAITTIAGATWVAVGDPKASAAHVFKCNP